MLRTSDWKITWDPDGGSPLVMLDFSDLMEREIRLPREQLAAVGRPDFAKRARLVSRGNRRGRLEFSRRDGHATAAACWQAAMAALKDAPWNAKGTLGIQPRGGSRRDYTAALLSSSHRASHQDGVLESIHSYAFRVTRQSGGILS
jgi:hypothetical protein